jgi:RNA polymerase sigma factor (sigma-70 family)
MTPELLHAVRGHARRLGARHLGFLDLRDLEQDAYVAILESAGRYDGSTLLTTFLDHRIHGAMIDGLRKWAPHRRSDRRPCIEWRPLPDDADEIWPAPDTHPLDLLIAAQRAHELRRALRRLPWRWRYLLYRRFYEQADHPTVARELGVSTNRAHQLQAKALARLKAAITR